MERRVYRILALAIAIFLLSLFFWWKGALNLFSPKRFEVVGKPRPIDTSIIARFPAPEKFDHVTYDGVELKEGNFMEFHGTCNDSYITVLLFRSGDDYRQDPARAITNRAFPCEHRGDPFSYRLEFGGVSGLTPGTYYGILADQGTTGLWYNPR